MTYSLNNRRSNWPRFDFRGLALSNVARAQLANIYEHVQRGSVPNDKLRLFTRLILPNAFDRRHGSYVPVADHPNVFRKFSEVSRELARDDLTSLQLPNRACFFGNPLLIPEGFEDAGFDLADASAPILRVTNAGFLVVTLEIDCESREQLEGNLAWIRGKDEDFRNAPFAEVDASLRLFKDYRGHCIVFTGNRSLHFHLVFSTAHLLNCPADALKEARSDEKQQLRSALMGKAHALYWDRAAEIFHEKLGSNIQLDRTLRGITQWRRTPWAIRTLEKDSEILGLPKGTMVPQIVLHENIRSRAPKGSSEFCVPETFSIADPVYATKRSKATSPTSVTAVNLNATPLIAELQEMCLAEWGAYPRPVSVERQNSKWLFRFQNHEGDRRPSTIVLGDHRKLLLLGKHSFGDKASFFLPEGLTAQELGDFLALSFGLVSTPAIASPNADPSPIPPEQRVPQGFEALRVRSKKPFLEQMIERVVGRFQAPITEDREALKAEYRAGLTDAVFESRVFANSPILIKSAEGIGKTSAHVPVLMNEALDRAMSASEGSRVQRFAAIASRSRDQAEAKTEEFAEILKARDADNPYSAGSSRRHTFVVKTFRDHYERACRELHETPIAKDDFEELTVDAILGKIEQEQPSVFERLEEIRKSLWDNATFDAGTTILFMTHKAAQCWQESRITRAWHHPDFNPRGGDNDVLAEEFQLADVVFDDPESDDFFHLLPGSLYQFLASRQAQYPNWRNLRLGERRDIYTGEKAANGIPSHLIKCFDDFDELMRLDLTELQPFEVDYDRIPYGQDNPNAKGIYRGRHGKRYYIGTKPWLSENSFRKVFLTTEDVVANVIERATGRGPFRLDLDHMDGLFPISVPFYPDRRAKADRGERYISELATEIRRANKTAIIVGDGIRADLDDTFTFQRIKGLNGFENRDLFILVTWLAPDKYAELNILGQWLDKDDVIERHYEDQINQAVGRNRGFRDSATATQTVVVGSKSLWSKFLGKFMGDGSRVRLYPMEEKPWDGVAPQAQMSSSPSLRHPPLKTIS